MVSEARLDTPLQLAVTRAVMGLLTAAVRTANGVLSPPAGTVTWRGTFAAGLLVASVMVTSSGAWSLSVTSPLTTSPPRTLVRSRLTPARDGPIGGRRSRADLVKLPSSR
jgi:hypothetical protein